MRYGGGMMGSSYSKSGRRKKASILKKASIKGLCAAALPALCALAASAPGVIADPSADAITATTVSRYFLIQADARCHALPADAATALKAGYLQARNTALRSGHSMADLSPWLERARDAAAHAPCDDARLTAQFSDAASAYRRFIVQSRLDLPGDRADWRVDRSYGDAQNWRLVQYQATPDAELAFGIYGALDAPRFTVMAHFSDGQTPYAARLLLRDAGQVSAGRIEGGAPGVTMTPPPGFGEASLAFMARNAATLSAVLHPAPATNMAGFTLTGEHAGVAKAETAIRFDFPSRAWPAIAHLDPREDMVVEFDFDSGPRYVRFEVGDFIPGLIYVTLPQPYTHAQSPTT
jgi:hypothetical protein